LDREANVDAGQDALVVAGLDLDFKVTTGQKAEDGLIGIVQIQNSIINDDVASALEN
jgi:hypothetical protein